jgi:hypothetical protein
VVHNCNPRYARGKKSGRLYLEYNKSKTSGDMAQVVEHLLKALSSKLLYHKPPKERKRARKAIVQKKRLKITSAGENVERE